MRIIAGELGGRTLVSPSGKGIRPATDRVRGAIFNILANRLDFSGGTVLDLFAGTGSLGFEALSRGAVAAVFVDDDPQSIRTIGENIDRLGVADLCTVVNSDALRFVQESGEKYILVFSDPPYKLAGLPEMPGTILRSGILAPGAILVVEHPSGISFGTPGPVLTKKYGGTCVSFFSAPDTGGRSDMRR